MREELTAVVVNNDFLISLKSITLDLLLECISFQSINRNLINFSNVASTLLCSQALHQQYDIWIRQYYVMFMKYLLPLKLTMTQFTAQINQIAIELKFTFVQTYKEYIGFEYFVAHVREVYLVRYIIISTYDY